MYKDLAVFQTALDLQCLNPPDGDSCVICLQRLLDKLSFNPSTVFLVHYQELELLFYAVPRRRVRARVGLFRHFYNNKRPLHYLLSFITATKDNTVRPLLFSPLCKIDEVHFTARRPSQ